MTQYERIEQFLRTAGKRGASYLDLETRCRSTCPWKRLKEMESRGWSFNRWTKPHKGRAITLVSLAKCPAR